MRIALTTTEYVTEKTFDGGLSNYVHRVAIALKNKGHDPVVFTYSDRNKTFVHRNVEVHCVDCRLPDEFVKWPLKILAKLYQTE
jgi:hypothetical protein